MKREEKLEDLLKKKDKRMYKVQKELREEKKLRKEIIESGKQRRSENMRKVEVNRREQQLNAHNDYKTYIE